MTNEDVKYFQELKKFLEKKYKSEFEDCNLSISDWKITEIRKFQEMMLKEVNGRISEKWFYTHLKAVENKKLPRIDTLNLLCEFVGYENWEDFLNKNRRTKDENSFKDGENIRKKIQKPKKKIFTISISTGLFLIILIYTTINAFGQRKYEFSFYNIDTKEKIESNEIEIILLNEKESPKTFFTDEKGCFSIKTNENEINFIVKAPYFKNDTISRKLIEKDEKIYLKTDDYALMIHIFSNSKIEDWEKRKLQLETMISENAQIFQVDKTNNGLEMYNKTDFINKMIIPVNSLQNIEIIETIYEKEQITYMKFIQN